MNVFTLHHGTSPLIVSLPHVGIAIPKELQDRFMPRALISEDTDRHLERLYDFAIDLGASLLVSHYSRYLIDLNRPPDNQPMYPGANNTELCPTHFFTGDALYRPGCEPLQSEVESRRVQYWQPYHDALAREIQQVKERHGHAILYDGHSIRSRLPWLFEGKLPDLNLGTANGASCSETLRNLIIGLLQSQTEFTTAIDGRFKGGYITRHYGDPANDVHAVQMEMCQSLYMNETEPYEYREQNAESVRQFFRSLLMQINRPGNCS